MFTTAGYDIKLEVYDALSRLNPSTKPGLSLGFQEEGSGLGTEGSFHHAIQTSCVRDHDAIIGRWSLPWNLLSKQPHSRSKASRGLPGFSSHRRARRRSMDSFSYGHRGFSPLVDCS